MIEIKERPILFSGPMVRAILDGRKTMTRRVRGLECVNETSDEWAIVRPMQPVEPTIDGESQEFPGADDNSWLALKDERGITDGGYNCISCPYGRPGDRLWVREPLRADERGMYYDADETPVTVPDDFEKTIREFVPSSFMPRWASRITLEITSVRVERLQDVSEEDAKSEGLLEWESPDTAHRAKRYGNTVADVWEKDPRQAFARLWDKINGKKHPWASNPWVWVIEFKLPEAK